MTRTDQIEKMWLKDEKEEGIILDYHSTTKEQLSAQKCEGHKDRNGLRDH